MSAFLITALRSDMVTDFIGGVGGSGRARNAYDFKCEEANFDFFPAFGIWAGRGPQLRFRMLPYQTDSAKGQSENGPDTKRLFLSLLLSRQCIPLSLGNTRGHAGGWHSGGARHISASPSAVSEIGMFDAAISRLASVQGAHVHTPLLFRFGVVSHSRSRLETVRQ